MYMIAENLVTGWERLKNKFKPTKTLTDKNMLIAMMYQPWELCDDGFTKWSEVNEITLPAKKPCAWWLPTTCTLTKYASSVIVNNTSTNRTLHTQHDTYPNTRIQTHAKKRIRR